MLIVFYLLPTDRLARIWDVETAQCLLKYLGHKGSGKLETDSWKSCKMKERIKNPGYENQN